MSGRPCLCCISDARQQIDEALSSGIPTRQLAARYDMSDSSLQRHKSNCISMAVAKHKHDADELSASALLNTLTDVQTKAEEVYARNAGLEDDIALKSLQRITSVVEMKIKIAALAAQHQASTKGKPSYIEIVNETRLRRNREYEKEQKLLSEISRLKILAGEAAEVIDVEPTRERTYSFSYDPENRK
jgi:hypothetical protein